jgi:hypothetical protein
MGREGRRGGDLSVATIASEASALTTETAALAIEAPVKQAAATGPAAAIRRRTLPTPKGL